MRIAVINSSPNVYNLAVHRMAKYFRRQGDEVFVSTRADMWAHQCDKALVSVIFTWDLPAACQDIRNLRGAGVEVEVGGPAATAMAEYIESVTGVKPHAGLDQRFEHEPGDNYEMVFTSRGCPRGCEFCIVQKVEGRKMIEYENYQIPVGANPYVSDNNILATSWEHQLRFAERFKDVRNLDINSGFDDRIFIKDPEKYYQLYKPLHLEAWRFAFDGEEQRVPIKECADFLHGKGVDYRRIIVFCLCGWPGTTFDQARERLQYLIDIGVSPYPMQYRPLDSLTRDFIPPGWQKGDLGLLFNYYGNPFVWRTCKYDEYTVEYKHEQKYKRDISAGQSEYQF